MSDQSIYPGELAAVVAFVFAPPLLVAFGIQAFYFTKRGTFACEPWRAVSALAFTALASVIGGTGVLLASPEIGNIPSVLGLTEVRLAGHYWPVLPLAFIVVGIVAPLGAWWATRAR